MIRSRFWCFTLMLALGCGSSSNSKPRCEPGSSNPACANADGGVASDMGSHPIAIDAGRRIACGSGTVERDSVCVVREPDMMLDAGKPAKPTPDAGSNAGQAGHEAIELRCGDDTRLAGTLCVAIDAGVRTVVIDGGHGLQCGPGTVEVAGRCLPFDAGIIVMEEDDAGPPLMCGAGTYEDHHQCVKAECSSSQDCPLNSDCESHVCVHHDPAPRNPVEAENRQAGTGDWVLNAPATSREIEGYASSTSVARGETIDLFVNTAANQFTIDIYRMGYYGGLGARAVLSATHPGTVQITPNPGSDGLIECDWTNPYILQIPNDWVSGVYLAKLTNAGDGKQSYIVFVVREDARVSDILFQSSVTTFEAYNSWGGKSLYDFNSTGGRAHKVSFNRPYGLGLNVAQAARGLGAGEVLTTFQDGGDAPATAWEYSMLRFLERNGYDVTYATNIDTDADPALLANHKAFLSVGHDEYWSWGMRTNVENARDRLGTQIGMFSGNVCYWQIRFEPDLHAVPRRTIVGYKDETLDPLQGTADGYLVTTRYALPPLSTPESSLVGSVFQAAGVHEDMVVDDESSWTLAGTGLRHGDHLPGLLGYEVNLVAGALPAGVSRIMHSPWSTNTDSGIADTVTFQVPSGAWTFSAGSMQLPWGLDDFGSADVGRSLVTPAAQRFATNILTRLLSTPVPAVSPILLSDDFANVDNSDWVPGVVSEGTSAFDVNVTVVRDNYLTITPRAHLAGLHHGGFVTARSWDMTDGAASVELVQGPNPASATDATFALSLDAGHWVRFTLESTKLLTQMNDGSGVNTQSFQYDATNHRFLRIRHERASNEFLWEASPDGVTFTTLRRSANTLAVAAMWAELEAGTYEAETTPGIVRFDHLLLQQTGFADDFTAARKAEHWIPAVLTEGPSNYDPEIAPIQFGGKLRLRPAVSQSGAHASGYVSARAWDFTDGEAQVDVNSAASTSAETVFGIALDAANYARIKVSNGTIAFQGSAAGVPSETSASFDAVAQRFWKLAHHAQAQTLEWLTSADGNSWASARTLATPFAVTAVRAELGAGTTQPVATPGEAVFDDFRVREGKFAP